MKILLLCCISIAVRHVSAGETGGMDILEHHRAEANALAFTLAGVEEQTYAPESAITPALPLDLIKWEFHANGAVANQYVWQGETKRAMKHYAVALRAAENYYTYEKASYEGDVQRNEYGEWMLDEQYKLSLLAFMGLLYGKARQAEDTPLRPRTVEHTSADAATGAAAAASGGSGGSGSQSSFGAEAQPHHQAALDKVPPISEHSLRIDYVAAGGITAEELREKYIKLNRPLLIGKGLIEDWPAKTKWTIASLMESHSDMELKVGKGPQPDNKHKTMTPEMEEDLAAFKTWLKEHTSKGWVYEPETNELVKGKERHLLDPPPPPGFRISARVNREGASTMKLAEFVEEVLLGKPNASDAGPEVRYVFNTLENHKLGKDFGVPDIVSRSVLKPAAVGEDATTKSGVFEWILGPAGSGSHPHCHSGAWNAVVYGEKRWIAWPPGMLNERAVNLTMPAIEFFTDVVPGLVSEGTHLYEFVQREGEVVILPDQWGHAILNTKPGVGASRQLPEYRYHHDFAFIEPAVAEATKSFSAAMDV